MGGILVPNRSPRGWCYSLSDNRDLSLADIATSYQFFGNPPNAFNAYIPANSIIYASFAGRLRTDTSSGGNSALYLGLLIDSVVHWFGEANLNGTAGRDKAALGPSVAGQFREFSGLGSTSGYGAEVAMDWEAMGYPSGLKSVQVIVARDANATASILGASVVTSKVTLTCIEKDRVIV